MLYGMDSKSVQCQAAKICTDKVEVLALQQVSRATLRAEAEGQGRAQVQISVQERRRAQGQGKPLGQGI